MALLPPASDPSWKVGLIAIGLAVAACVALHWTLVRPQLEKQDKHLQDLQRQWDKGARATDVLARTVMAQTQPRPAPQPPIVDLGKQAQAQSLDTESNQESAQ